MRRLAAFALVACVLAGCGDRDNGSDARVQLVVSAASSLRTAFTAYAPDFPQARLRFQFAGSDELAGQIRAGGRTDVFAAANTKLPRELYIAGKVEQPLEFTANRLVLAVPKTSDVKSLDDVARPGVKLAIGSETVPIGTYTRDVLSGLPATTRNQILANVKTAEPDASGIVGKLTQGAVDAGFVYATDVKAADGKLRAIQLPARLQPTVVYAAAVVKETKHHFAAEQFIHSLRKGDGVAALRNAGFLPVPR